MKHGRSDFVLYRSAVAVLAGLLLFAGAAWAARPTVYLFNSDGRLLGLDPTSWEVKALWSLEETAGLAGRVPRGLVEGGRLPGLAFDGQRQLLYLVLPDEALPDESYQKGFKVVSVSLPFFRVMAEYHLPRHLESPPHVLFEPGRRELYVQWDDRQAVSGEVIVTVVTILDGSQLKERRSLRHLTALDPRTSSPAAPLPLLLPPAHFLPGTMTAVSGSTLIRFTEQGLTVGRAELPAELGEKRLARLRELYPDDPSDSRRGYYFWMTAAAADRAVFTVMPTRSAAVSDVRVVVDLVSGEVLGFLETPLSTAVLTRDGRHLVLLELADPRRTSGRVEVRDAASGELELAFESELLAGDPRAVRLLCAGPDGQSFLWHGDGNRVVVTEPGRELTLIPAADFFADAATHCLFTEP